MEMKFEWIAVDDHLPKYEDDLYVLVYTEGVDFQGEQFFVILATDMYVDQYDEYRDEIVDFITHWTYIPLP